MSYFDNFANPFPTPRHVPEKYRRHPALQRLFVSDEAYLLPAEGPVQMWAIYLLVEHYGVPLDALQHETPVDASEGTHTQGRRWLGYVDLVVYDDRYIGSEENPLDVAFIAVEAMEPGKPFEGTGEASWQEHLNRLNAYCSNSPSIRYAVLTSGKHTILYRRDLEYPRALQPIGDLPKYESAREAAKHSPFKVIYNPKNPAEPRTGLQPLTREKFREVLGDTRSGCHSILRDNEGLQPQEAVDAMVKFLFAKWYDEQATVELVKEKKEERAYVFSVSPETDPERLLIQVRETFEQAKQWERQTLKTKFGDDLAARVAFTEGDVLQFKPHTTAQIVKRLQPWSLRQSSADVKGGVFEDFLSKTFRDDLGQYFTPTPVINLMVGILQPTVDDIIGDPACGSARMLTHALEYVRKQEYEKAVAENGGSAARLDPDEPTPAFVKFRDNYLFGVSSQKSGVN